MFLFSFDGHISTWPYLNEPKSWITLHYGARIFGQITGVFLSAWIPCKFWMKCNDLTRTSRTRWCDFRRWRGHYFRWIWVIYEIWFREVLISFQTIHQAKHKTQPPRSKVVFYILPHPTPKLKNSINWIIIHYELDSYPSFPSISKPVMQPVRSSGCGGVNPQMPWKSLESHGGPEIPRSFRWRSPAGSLVGLRENPNLKWMMSHRGSPMTQET